MMRAVEAGTETGEENDEMGRVSEGEIHAPRQNIRAESPMCCAHAANQRQRKKACHAKMRRPLLPACQTKAGVKKGQVRGNAAKAAKTMPCL